jgi:putative peptide modification target (TIGR04139 family)
MKKLTGMKKNFSSLENKKLVDLKSIQGGIGGGSASVENSNAFGANSDLDYYSDASGSWKWVGRVVGGV